MNASIASSPASNRDVTALVMELVEGPPEK